MKYKGRPNNMQTLTKKIFTCYKIIISFSICIDSIKCSIDSIKLILLNVLNVLSVKQIYILHTFGYV